jgi:pyruvate dehydrogenase E2 component (dihydrolipoamide acetyltransferase)
MAQEASPAVNPRRPVLSAPDSPTSAVGSGRSDYREAIAAAVSAAWRDIPHFAVAREIDAERLLMVKQASRERVGERLTITDFLIFALSETLVSTGREANVGLAVSTDRGVVTRVIPSISGMSLSAIAVARSQLVERARSGRALAEDSSPTLITLSNLGAEGVSWFTGIIPQGQQALLATGTVTRRAVVRCGALSVASEMTAVLNVDHRSLDGVDAAQVLRTFAEQVENLTEAVLT